MKGLGKFAAGIIESSTRKRNNHAEALSAKVQIRRNVLDAIGPTNAHVFDAFAGEGEMFRNAWAAAASYTGCDKTWYNDDRLMFCGDNRRVMRAISLASFTIFDFDSWGSPWELVHIVCARRPLAAGERLGLVLTEGSGLRVKMGTIPRAFAAMAGLREKLDGAASGFDRVLESAIAGVCRRLSCRVVRRWQAHGRTGAKVYYIGLVLEAEATKSGPATTPEHKT